MAPAELWGRDGASLFCFDVCSRMREFEPSNWIKVSGYISLSAGICLGSDARRLFFFKLEPGRASSPFSPVQSGLWLHSGSVCFDLTKGNCFQSLVPDVSTLLRADLQIRRRQSLMGQWGKKKRILLLNLLTDSMIGLSRQNF